MVICCIERSWYVDDPFGVRVELGKFPVANLAKMVKGSEF